MIPAIKINNKSSGIRFAGAFFIRSLSYCCSADFCCSDFCSDSAGSDCSADCGCSADSGCSAGFDYCYYSDCS